MKRYLLFTSDQYYPSGGWEDFKGGFDTIEAAKGAVPDAETCCGYDLGHIVDTETQQIITAYNTDMGREPVEWRERKCHIENV